MTRPFFSKEGVAGICAGRRGFTLVELLVVIAIIALLIAILLPALASARKTGQAVKCATNMHDVGAAMGVYLAENQSVFPPSYVYPDGAGNVDYVNQDPSHPFGYQHWSYYLYGKGAVHDSAFKCPTYSNGGAPRTNPGPGGGERWEEGQVDDQGQSGGGTLEDRQAPRMAYTGNAAIFPRNKFTQDLSGGPRVNVCVPENQVRAGTILLAEFFENWKGIGLDQGGGVLSKSHRPVNPFFHIGFGSDEYQAPLDTPGFTYGDPPYYGLLPRNQLSDQVGLVDNPGLVETNAVGRHHVGGNDPYIGGASNFLYMDGHTERKTVLDTVKRQEWGGKYYAINGHNKVGPPW